MGESEARYDKVRQKKGKEKLRKKILGGVSAG